MYNLSISHINSDMASITDQISRLCLRIRNTVTIGLLSFRGTIQSYSEVSIHTLYKSGTVCSINRVCPAPYIGISHKLQCVIDHILACSSAGYNWGCTASCASGPINHIAVFVRLLCATIPCISSISCICTQTGRCVVCRHFFLISCHILCGIFTAESFQILIAGVIGCIFLRTLSCRLTLSRFFCFRSRSACSSPTCPWQI